jgi:hypothetical protein
VLVPPIVLIVSKRPGRARQTILLPDDDEVGRATLIQRRPEWTLYRGSRPNS